MSAMGLPEADLPEGEIVDEFLEDESLLDSAAEAFDAEARKQGWKPLAEFRGDPTRWVDAKTYVERGNTFLPFVQKERDELRGTVQRMSTQVTELRESNERSAAELVAARKDMQAMLAYTRRAEDAGYQRAIAELEAERRQAVQEGDVSRYDAAGARIESLERERATAAPPAAPEAAPQPEPKPQNRDPVVEAFVRDNEGWFLRDKTLNAAMIAEDTAIQEAEPGLPRADQLERAKTAVMNRFPAKFGRQAEPAPQQQPQRRPAAPIPTPAARGGDGQFRAKTGIAAIEDPKGRQDARVAFQRAQRNMPDVTEAEFLAIWEDPHADVLHVMDEAGTSKKARTNAKR